MPFVKTALAELGGTEPHKGEYRAHLHFRNETSAQVNIRGPTRETEEEAQRDLDQIRAAGLIGKTREEGLKIMEAEAQRIRISAQYQTQIQANVIYGSYGRK